MIPDTARVSQDPRQRAFVNNPYDFYRERHETGPRFFWDEFGHWCFARFDDVNAVFRDRRFGTSLGIPERNPRIENWYETERYSLLAMDPPDHSQMRGLVNRAFLSRQVEKLRPRIADLANELIDGFVDDGHVEMLSSYAAPLPATVIAEMIGLPRSKTPELLDWSNRMVQMYMYGVDDTMEIDADAAAAAFVAYLREVVAERRLTPTDDLLSHMLSVELDGERLSEPEVIATTILLLNAGHEATVHTTGNAIRTLLKHRDTTGIEPMTLLDTPERAAATVEECLRFDPPLHMFVRYALDDFEFDGIEFTRGQRVGLLLGAANHDPQRFVDPDRFDPHHDDAGNVSFGAGIHFCIGAPLARIELQTSLSTVFERLPGLKLASEPDYRNIYHFHGLDTLDVAW